MKPDSLIFQRDSLRLRWREVRTVRLELKKVLEQEGESAAELRHNREYKRLKKEQKRLSVMIKHAEKKLFKGRKNEA